MNLMKKLRVDVVMGGPGKEAAVSRSSGSAIVAALARRGHDVLAIDCQGELELSRLRAGAVVFNIIHGTYGEDGRLQTLLERAGKAYVGSDSTASALCMDKERTKARLREAGIRVPWGVRVHLGQPFSPKDLRLPHYGGLVLKPACDGSSVGVRMIPSPSFVLPACEELIAEMGPVPYLIEERLPGPEYTVAIIEDSSGSRFLPPICIRASEGVYDYQSKYVRNDTRYDILPLGELAQRLGAMAMTAFTACGCRDFARADIMATADGDLAMLEINTLPGFTDHSLTPKAAAAAGISFDELVELLAMRASERQAEKVSP
jgi:D-alanine-D-alanine ligase